VADDDGCAEGDTIVIVRSGRSYLLRCRFGQVVVSLLSSK
jgi:hypothetical protein